jgi:hypothetical protein
MNKALAALVLSIAGIRLLCGEEPPRDGAGPGAVRRNDFSSDPRWQSHRTRLLGEREPRMTRQAFGHSRTRHAGGEPPGEIGGFIQRSVTPAWYAARIQEKTLNDRLSASGKLAVTRAESGSGMLFGWFHESSRGWRTSNSLVFRLDGNGERYWAFYEYGTRNWLTGGAGCFDGDAYQTTKTKPFAADGTVHEWSLAYDPDDNEGGGGVTFTLDGKRYTLRLAPSHKLDGATFNRFGILNQQASGDGMEVYFDDVVLDGRRLTFEDDPRWEGRANQGSFADRFVRPLNDFGFSQTSFAGGGKGEIGGVVWRDEPPAFYADRVGPLTLGDELFAEGSISLTRATSDSGVYIGWFDAKSKLEAIPSPSDGIVPEKSLLGVLVEGPSRDGHYFRAAYRTAGGEGKIGEEGPIIKPDGEAHEWSIRYTPGRGGEAGRIVVRFDRHERVTEVLPEHVREETTFDRFGIFNFSRDGMFVEIYVDDVRYTAGREKQ